MPINPSAKILVIAREGLGDALFFCPALEALRAQLPHARIDVLVGQAGAEHVFRHNPWWNNLYPIRPGVVGCQLRQLYELWKTGYDMTILPLPSGYRSGLIGWILRVPVRLGHDQTGGYAMMRYLLTHALPVSEHKHKVESNIDLLRAFGLLPLEPTEIRVRYQFTAEQRESGRRFLSERGISGNLIGVHPGCKKGIAERRWPAEKYSSLLKQLCETWNLHALVFGTKEEQAEVREIVGGLAPRATPVLDCALELAAALIENCALFVANDSGPLHLANALGVPVVGIYGPTDPRQVGPFNPGGTVVRSGIGCSPCCGFSPFFRCVQETNICMRDLEVGHVQAACEAVLDMIVRSESVVRDASRNALRVITTP
ncbi:MAG: glycosyltransferase family 9 protein [Terriglobia bacterium]